MSTFSQQTKHPVNKHAKKLISIETTKKDWEQYSLWGRFGMRVGQIIGLIEINIKP